MYVCHCRIVTDRQVRDAIEQGCRTLEGIGERCAAGSGCGTCHDLLEELLLSLVARA